GATNWPKPRMRVAPPALPEDLIGRLRPKDDEAADTATEQPRRQEHDESPEAKRQAAGVTEQPSPDAQETSCVVSDSLCSPTADGNDMTQPLPGPSEPAEPRR